MALGFSRRSPGCQDTRGTTLPTPLSVLHWHTGFHKLAFTSQPSASNLNPRPHDDYLATVYFVELEDMVQAGLDSVSHTTIRRFAGRIDGLGERQDFAERQEGSHRRGMGEINK